MSYSMSDLKKGLRIEIEGVPYRIVEYQHVKPGKGPAFVRIKIRSYINGKVLERTFHAGDKCEKPNLQERQMQYLYDDGEFCQFMDTQTYEQIAISDESVGDSKKWLLDGMMVDILFHNDVPIGIEVPPTVELKIIETAPNFRGDTQGSNKKPATLETGAVVHIPFYILEGETIKVDTDTGEYLERVK